MNYSGKFDARIPIDHVTLDTHGHGHVDSFSAHATHAPAGAIIVADTQLLFNGDFKRSGVDLILSKDDHHLVLEDYFKGEKRAALSAPDGAHLSGDLVNALTGHVQYSQADGSASVSKVIGHVTKLTGTATAIRNGVSIILNNGDNVEKGDVVQSGSNSTLGITFIDGTVFGLSSNARMVLNEMVYDPNGSNNSSLLSLVAGTISFVAGETAKHGDMKVDTPVATMGIRGTAVLVEIDFEIPGQGGAPNAKFQVLVEPDGSTGSYILFDKNTLTPIATVNQAGQQINISQGQVSITNAPLPPDIQKLISDVFSLKFTDNTNTKSFTKTTDSVVPETVQPIKLANGTTATPVVTIVNKIDTPAPQKSGGPIGGIDHIPGPPKVGTTDVSLKEFAGKTGDIDFQTITSHITWEDINAGDTPSATVKFGSFTFQNANGEVVTALSDLQLADIGFVSVDLFVDQDAGNTNYGSATWTYMVRDHAFDFLAAGETLTLTYIAEVTNNFKPFEERTFKSFTITITGTNDAPTIVAGSTIASGGVIEDTNVDSSGNIVTSGTVTFNDVDLTDTHTATFTLKSSTSTAHLPGFINNSTNIGKFTLTAVSEDNPDPIAGGSLGWTFKLEDSDPILQSLALGQIITQVYTVTVSDGHGGTVTQDVTVTIAGTNDSVTNDAPEIVVGATTATGAVTEDANVDGATGKLVASGTIVFEDIDLIDTHTASFVFTSSTSNAHLPESNSDTQIGAFELTPVTEDNTDVDPIGSVGWSYKLPDNDPTLQSLAFGQTLKLVYTVTIRDNHGAQVDQVVTITITGSNDGPVITAATTPALTSGGVVEDGVPSASGVITFQDVDLIDTHHLGQALTGGSASVALPNFNPATQPLGTLALTLHENNGDNVNTGMVDWTFTIDNTLAQQLAFGQVITQIYTVTITDNNGAPVTQDLTVTITGTNDNALITVGSGNSASGAVTEDTHVGSETATGTLSFSDVDLIDTHSVTGVTPSGGALGTLTASVTTDDSHATGTGGVITWTYSVPDSAIQYLAQNETRIETFTVHLFDGTSTVDKVVTVTITGTNDDALITVGSGNSASGAVTEDAHVGSETATGTLSFSDVDLIDTHSVTGVTASGGALGTLTASVTTDDSHATGAGGVITWTYSVPDSAIQYLAQDATKIETFTVHLFDGTSTVDKVVTVTLTGANDQTVLTSVNAAPVSTTVPESAGDSSGQDIVPIAGSLAFSDKDIGDSLAAAAGTPTISINGSPLTSKLSVEQANALTAALNHLQFGDGVVSNGGNQNIGWTWDPAAANLDFLQTGDNLTVTYAVHVGDSAAQNLTFTITGTNDAPVAHDDNLFPAGNGWVLNQQNGHYYRFVPASVDWSGATSAASNDGAYLATITSQGENTFISHLISGTAWTSGNTSNANPAGHSPDPSTWSWSSGPEAATLFSYTNWNPGEPNGGFGSTGAALQVAANGTWNDVPTTSGWNAGYVEEWGGLQNQPVFREGADTTLTTAQLLVNDTDVDSSNLTILGVSSTSAHGGTVSLNGNTITYHPATNYGGTDSFTYTVSDGALTSSATVSFNVARTAEPPALFLNPTPQPLGNEFLVNTTTANDQTYSAIGALSDGGFLIAWVSAGQDGSGTGIYAQRYDSAGVKVNGEFRVNTATADDQSSPFVASLGGGGFVVSWTSGSNNAASIHAQVYSGAGAAVGGEFTVATGENSTIAALANGGFVVTYVSTDGDTGGTFARLYNAGGVAVGSSFLINTTTASQQQGDSVAATPDGGFIASWHSFNQDASGTWGVYFQRFDASGNKLGPETRANTTVAGDQYGGELAVLKDGTFVISWIDSPSHSLVVQHFTAGGAAVGVELVIPGATTDTVQALPDGGYFITYMGSDAAGSLGLFGQRVDASGSLSGSAFLINQTVAGDQSFLSDRSTPTAVLASGTIASSWFGAPNIAGSEIYGRLFSLPGVGLEDTAIKLALATESSETAAIKLSGFPAGATFSKGTAGVGADAGFWVISNASDITSLATTPLTVTPPANFAGQFTLHVTAAVTDSATTTRDFAVTVLGVADSFTGTAGNDTFTGYGGSDTFNGLGAFDRVNYINATGAITASLAAGTVAVAGVGTDHLISIEGLRGSNFADTFDATGFAGDSLQPGTPIGFNEFEGRGGNDTITGLVNSQGAPLTRVSYVNATAGVTVDFDAKTADGNSSVGHDTFIGGGVAQVIGSAFVDHLSGSNNPFGTVEVFDGRAGDDIIDGRGGFDRVDYNGDATTTSGISVNLAAGTVTAINPLDHTVGNDTLISIEAVRGTLNNDTYDATGFGSGSINAGSNGAFNEFTGVGGTDTVIGNGSTRLSFTNAPSGVSVNLQTGATPGTGVATASFGTINFSGVNAVHATMFDDTLIGSSNNDNFTGLGGNDSINGGGGFDIASYFNIYYVINGGVTIDLARGTATGDPGSIGSDTLRSIEGIQGTTFADTYVATAYGSGSIDPDTGLPYANVGNNGTFNQFEGLGGDDSITGNGNTRLIYANATGGVNVNFVTHKATGNDSVGTDSFTLVNSVTGSAFDDTFTGDASTNVFIGGAGNDAIDGGDGTDVAVFSGPKANYAISFNTPTPGHIRVQSAADGTDDLVNVELLQFTDTIALVASGSSGIPIDLAALTSTIPFNAITPLTGSANDFVLVNPNWNGRSIDLGGGTGDTIVLAASAGGYLLNVTNVENVKGSSGNDNVTLQNIASGLAIDLGTGADILNLAGGSNTLSIVNVEQVSGTDFAVGNVSNDILTLTTNVTGVSVNLGNGDNTLNLAAGANSLNTLFGVQSINGTSSADVLNLTGPGVTKVALGLGNDILNLSPQSGGVTFVYADGGGADVVSGFSGASADKIDLSGVSGIGSLADVQSHATAVGADTVINFGAGNSITLQGVALGNLAEANFVFGTKPILSGDNVTVDEGAAGVATVHGIHLTDNDPSAILSVTAVAGQGTLTPASISGATESAINAQFTTGVVYNPSAFNDANQVNDIVTVSVTDNHGLTDALHFVFQQSGTGGTTLTGTDGKDIIFSTGGNDTLTGLGGRDNFVFAPSGSPAQYTITDFSVGLDKIDIRQFAGLSAATPPTEVQQGSDVLITLDNNDTLLLKNVSVPNLHNTDFIFHG